MSVFYEVHISDKKGLFIMFFTPEYMHCVSCSKECRDYQKDCTSILYSERRGYFFCNTPEYDLKTERHISQSEFDQYAYETESLGINIKCSNSTVWTIILEFERFRSLPNKGFLIYSHHRQKCMKCSHFAMPLSTTLLMSDKNVKSISKNISATNSPAISGKRKLLTSTIETCKRQQKHVLLTF